MAKQHLFIAIILLVLSGCGRQNNPIVSTRQPTNHEIMSEVDVELEDSVHQFFEEEDNEFYSSTDFMAEQQDIIGLNEFYELAPEQSYATLDHKDIQEEMEEVVFEEIIPSDLVAVEDLNSSEEGVFEEYKTAVDVEQVDVDQEEPVGKVDLDEVFAEVASNIDVPSMEEITIEDTQEPIT